MKTQDMPNDPYAEYRMDAADVELFDERMTFEEYETFQFNEKLNHRNAINRVINYAIICMLFLIASVTWYLVAVGTIAWYAAVVLSLVFAIIGLFHTVHTNENIV